MTNYFKSFNDKLKDIWDLVTTLTVVDGKLVVQADLEVADIEIGAVELKNSSDDTRAIINANGSLNVNWVNAEVEIEPLEGEHDIALAGTATSLGERPITGAVTLDKSFKIDGDWSRYIIATEEITVSGSTGNDGTYTIVSATYATGSTTIIVSEAVPDETADGVLMFSSVPIHILMVQAKEANTNDIVVGSVSCAIGKGVQMYAGLMKVYEANEGKYLDLNKFYADVTTNGEGLVWEIVG